MPQQDSIQLEFEKRQELKQKAQEKLDFYKGHKLTLKRPAFFVPGWTDESGRCWQPLKKSFKEIFTNPELAYFIDFNQETKQCKSFLDFGEVLKHKIHQHTTPKQKFDAVGHSMGGLDIRAAITQGPNPLLNCAKCITVATPHWGDQFGGMRYSASKSFLKKVIDFFNPLKTYQVEQGKSLDPNYPPIKLINTLENRRLFVERLEHLFLLNGTRDFVVKGSAILDPSGIEALYTLKVKRFTVEGSNHSGDIGICQDIRTMILIVYLLMDLFVPEDEKNAGILLGGNFKPGDNPNRFV